MRRAGRHIALGLCVLTLCGALTPRAAAQVRRGRGPVQTTSGGMMPRPDTLARDTLDSLPTRDTLPAATSVAERRVKRDTIGLSGMTWIGVVAPGFGQVYNRQYWKVPILYAAAGASATFFIQQNRQYRPLKRRYDALSLEMAALDYGSGDFLTKSRERNALRERMIRTNTRRQLYLGAAIASYLYFLGDGVVNYRYETTGVKRATTLSTLFPGAGQVYNKSYWKLPFVMGGLASTIYVVDWNNRGYTRFKRAYGLRVQYDKEVAALPADTPEENLPVSLDEFGGAYSADFLKDLKDSYRRNRDLALIITAGLYFLQIVDAHVDAHMKDFDVSDDLTVDLAPTISYAFLPMQSRPTPIVGFNLSVKF